MIMVIQSCTFTIHFPQNPKIREHLFQLEEQLMDFQKPFTLVPIPADAPVDIPRIVATTPHGHSQVIFCGNSAQVVTKFDGDYVKNVEQSVEYIRQKCNRILEVLPLIDESNDEIPKFYFSGLSTTLELNAEDGVESPVSYISEKFLRSKIDSPIDEVQFRYALVTKEKFYVNVMVQNSRTFIGLPDERGSLAGLRVKDETLQVVLDINDRYAFNHEVGYRSSKETVSEITKITEEFMTKKLIHFIQTSEIGYDE